MIRFWSNGRHLDGGGDYIVERDDEYAGYLCFTKNAEDVWRARFVDTKGHGIERRTDDEADARRWVEELLTTT